MINNVEDFILKHKSLVMAEYFDYKADTAANNESELSSNQWFLELINVRLLKRKIWHTQKDDTIFLKFGSIKSEC